MESIPSSYNRQKQIFKEAEAYNSKYLMLFAITVSQVVHSNLNFIQLIWNEVLNRNDFLMK